MADKNTMERVKVSPDNKGFVLANSGKPFIPWAFNIVSQYGNFGNLVEDSWEKDWPAFDDTFRNMQRMGINVARVFPQFGNFMDAPDKPNAKALGLLAKMIELAEDTNVYLDITGLNCFRRKDTPAWYDALPEAERWQAQAAYFEAIAEVGAKSNAIFCYDLMNEPIAIGAPSEKGWYVGDLGGLTFCQYLTLTPNGRTVDEVGQQWVRPLVKAIRKHDKHGMITVGMLPDYKHQNFSPESVVGDLDYISVHIYPHSGQLENELAVLKRFNVGKPVVIEETFAMDCSNDELREFILASRPNCAGWFSHYAGEPQPAGHAAGVKMFVELGPQIKGEPTPAR